MAGHHLCEAARDSDTTKVGTLLCTPDAQSFINYQGVFGTTSFKTGCGVVSSLHIVTENGREVATNQLIDV